MKLFSKIRTAGMALALSLVAMPLAMADAGTTAIDEVMAAQEATSKQAYVQYELKGTLFSPVGIGNLLVNGNVVDLTPRKKNQERVTRAEAHGTAELVVLGSQKTMSTPVEAYAEAQGKKLTEYIKTDKGWGKTIVPFSMPTEEEIAQSLKDYRATLSSAEMIKEDSREKVYKVTGDWNKILDLQDRTAKKSMKVNGVDVAELLRQVKDVNYIIAVDKKTHRITALSWDLTPLLQTAGAQLMDAAATQDKNLDRNQLEMMKAMLKGSSLNLNVLLRYEKGKDVVIPAEVRNAKVVVEKA
ncbi:hypothetical protein [Acidaminococcus timonensis]|uniref:hypothetical protein n=1 Tax=Acidaminococcus timonensis TaxID=1871002 RepID=UPI00248BA2DA|nr:hypothetical protein [Acidaminococcus timonensis]